MLLAETPNSSEIDRYAKARFVSQYDETKRASWPFSLQPSASYLKLTILYMTDENWTISIADNPLGDTAHKQAGQSFPTMRTHNNKIA